MSPRWWRARRALLDEIARHALDGTLDYAARRRLVLDGVEDRLSDRLPRCDRPADQLRSDLAQLARRAPDEDGVDAIERWLERVEEVTGVSTADLRARWRASPGPSPPAARRARPVAWALGIAVVVGAVGAASWFAASDGEPPCRPADVSSPELEVSGVGLVWDVGAINRRLRHLESEGRTHAVERGALQMLSLRADGDGPVETRVVASADGTRLTLSWMPQSGTLITRWRGADGPAAAHGRVKLVLDGPDPLRLPVAEPERALSRLTIGDACWDAPPWPDVIVTDGRFRARMR